MKTELFEGHGISCVTSTRSSTCKHNARAVTHSIGAKRSSGWHDRRVQKITSPLWLDERSDSLDLSTWFVSVLPPPKLPRRGVTRAALIVASNQRTQSGWGASSPGCDPRVTAFGRFTGARLKPQHLHCFVALCPAPRALRSARKDAPFLSHPSVGAMSGHPRRH